MLGYENEGPGDGLVGLYYNNEDFSGPTVKRIDAKIDHEWDNENPVENVNYENFSVKWSGFLRVPATG